ncbi:bifunctional 2-C-methyl-D-erythritol 4-phosphate cytidylyltransferase/2-C-methyl-D-erythritol 2,4-cyclodiphosphate synthase [Parasphingorhabdus sp.]|uniref:bifunctional 2-C-methyl-D-erythritol 4-phosphate cytidylyltransferase/2-C-methyl-D-erythritol 2,4-cyclodiphosphate synthase n=1 Tax=Parasphingorhabdus sp. TaxID=2709688 RepID=UPI00326408B1
MTDSSPHSSTIKAIIVAAGRGERSGLDRPKQYQPIRGRPMIRHSVESFSSHPGVSEIWVVIGEDQEKMADAALEGLQGYKLVTGGATRQQSVFNGLSAIADNGGADIVLIHDAARPFLPHEQIDQLIKALDHAAGAIPVLPTTDTTIRVENDHASELVDRDSIWRVQTPQAFRFGDLLEAHVELDGNDNASDDAQIFQAAGHKVAVVPGDEILRKFTTARDFSETAGQRMIDVRTGSGFDVHRLVADEELWLGGLKIDHEKGLAGHSDADVLLHALTDALLGAIAAGDIGDHFPPSDPQWQGAASTKFVKHAVSLIKQKGARINSADMTLICEAPKIKPHRDAMRKNIAGILEIPVDLISLKATTTEGLGFTGRGEGIAAQAIVTISTE